MSTTSPPRPAPLHRHRRLRTTDLDEAENASGRVMSAHRLAAESPRDFRMRLHTVGLGSSTLAYSVLDGRADLTALAPMEYYTLQLVLSGGIGVTTELGYRRLGPGQACVLSPGERLRLRFAAATEHIAVKLPRAVVEQTYSRIGADVADGLVFAMDVPAGSAWPAVLRLAVDTVDRLDSSILPAAMGDELERMVVTATLLAQPHNRRESMVRGGGMRGYRAAGVAADLIAADPAAPLRPAELACAGGVSLRTLQEGFRSRFGTSLTSHQRELRLAQAHRLLSTAAPGTTVTGVAVSCGFLHFGRFARDYRRRYGLAPSVTLHSSRAVDNAARSG